LFLLKKFLWKFFYKKNKNIFFFNASPPARFLEKIERGGMLCSGGPKFEILVGLGAAWCAQRRVHPLHVKM